MHYVKQVQAPTFSRDLAAPATPRLVPFATLLRRFLAILPPPSSSALLTTSSLSGSESRSLPLAAILGGSESASLLAAP